MTNRKETLSRRRFATIGIVASLMPMPVVLDGRRAVAAERICRTDRFYTNADGSRGPSTLFPGKADSSDGWCKGWFARES